MKTKSNSDIHPTKIKYFVSNFILLVLWTLDICTKNNNTNNFFLNYCNHDNRKNHNVNMLM